MLQFFFFFHQFTLLKKEDALKGVLRRIARFHKVMQWKKAKENHLSRLLRCLSSTFNNKDYTSKKKEKKGEEGEGKKTTVN